MHPLEMLEEGRMLRQQDRGSALHYYEQQMQKAAISHDRELWLASSLTLAWELLESGQNDRGLIAQTVSVANPDYPYLILAQGRFLMAEGKFLEAIRLLQTPTKSDDLELQGLISDALARCFSITHQFDQAQAHFDRATALLSPHSFYLGFVSIHLGEMELFKQNFDYSEDHAQNALELSMQTEDNLLRFNALVLLTKNSLRRHRFDTARALIEDSQALVDPETDLLEVITLSLLEMEASCHDEDLPSVLPLWEYTVSRLPELNDWQTQQQANHLEGKIGLGKIEAGLVNLDEEGLEKLEDIFLDVALNYEEQQIYSCQALVLLDIARLYSFGIRLPTPYQFQGKSIRSVEQAGELLKQVGLQETNLGREIEQLYDRMLDHLSIADS